MNGSSSALTSHEYRVHLDRRQPGRGGQASQDVGQPGEPDPVWW
jgi:hypothetical protein